MSLRNAFSGLLTETSFGALLKALLGQPDGKNAMNVATNTPAFSDGFNGTAIDATKWDILRDSGMTYTIAGGLFTVSMGITPSAEFLLVGKETMSVPCDAILVARTSQNIPGNQIKFGFLEVDDAGVPVDHATLPGFWRNSAAVCLEGTSATSGNFLETMSTDAPSLLRLALTTASKAGLVDFGIACRPEDVIATSQTADSTTTKASTAARASSQRPSPVRKYRPFIQFLNGATPPATNTDVVIASFVALDRQELEVQINGTGSTVSTQSIGVTNAGGTYNVSGQVGANSTTVPNPVLTGVMALSAQPTAVTTGRMAWKQGDLAGRQVVKPGGVPQAHDYSRSSWSNTTEATVLAAVASNRHEIHSIIFANRDTIAHTFDLRNVAAGAILHTFIVPAGDSRQFTFPAGLANPSTNSPFTLQMREAATTPVEVSISSFRTTA